MRGEVEGEAEVKVGPKRDVGEGMQGSPHRLIVCACRVQHCARAASSASSLPLSGGRHRGKQRSASHEG